MKEEFIAASGVQCRDNDGVSVGVCDPEVAEERLVENRIDLGPVERPAFFETL